MTTRIEELEWTVAGAQLSAIRRVVFIDEQAVPEALEVDGLDHDCYHLLAFDGDQAVGTARMTPAGKIGRMAVLPAWRRQGVGQQLLAAMIKVAHRIGLTDVVLDAQVYAIPFYQRSGFEISSAMFMDAGIAHQSMSLRLY